MTPFSDANSFARTTKKRLNNCEQNPPRAKQPQIAVCAPFLNRQNLCVPLPLDEFAPSKRPRDILKTLSLFTLLLLPVAWTVELLVAENSSLSALLLYLPQHVFLLFPLLLGAWSVAKRRVRLTLVNAVSLAFCLVFPMGARMHFSPASSDSSVRLVTFNVQRGEGNFPLVEATLKALRPDIVCLQESGRSRFPQQNGVGRDIAARTFPTWNARFAGDVTTLSRFPVQSDHVHFLSGTRRTLETVLQTPTGPLRVLNTHVSTNFPGDRAPTSKLDRIALLFTTAKPSAQARLRQLPALRNAVEKGDARVPLVLTGDFNTPPRGHFYEGLARIGLEDAFSATGNGLGLSFPSRFPLLRIDFVWTRGARALKTFVANESGADHRPLVADIEVRS